MKRLLSFITAFAMLASVYSFHAHAAASYEEAAAAAENAVINYNRSIPLEVKGNKLVEQGTDNMVTLRGVNIPSLGWGMAEHIYESMTELYDSWNANLIRLPIQPKYWFDNLTDAERKPGVITGEEYQKYIDDVVKAAQARGKYVILDCHTYVMPLQESLDLWEVLAVKYGNNSAVLFGLLNEPHDIKPTGVDAARTAWDVWRNGGQITINNEEVTGIGHQQLLDAIRAKSANNICVAGGLNWAFDISGLADGYDGLPNGYRLTDTAAGHGVMYDSHAYPVKGAKSSWDKTIGPVRKVAPILIGEWGWDASDNAISGGDCTSNIWMNQLMNWMDDAYGEYDGIPVNWTGWNLHMSSSPRMLYSWDFKTTAFNGTYIKNRLKQEPEPGKFDGVYSTDFSTDGVFRSYTGVSGKSTVTYSADDENIVIYHQPTGWSAKLDFPYDWDLNGIQTITMDISADINETINVGLYGSDEEVWITPIDVTGDVKTITVRVDQLIKQGNPLTDGILNGALSGIYFGSTATAKGNITVDNIKIVKLAEPVYTAKTYPHEDTGAESYIDIDNTNFPSRRIDNGPGAGSYFRESDVTIEGVDGEETLAKLIEYNRINGPWGGSALLRLGTVPSKDTKYFTVCLKGSGTAQEIGVSVGDIGTFRVTFEEGDTEWHQYIYGFEGNIEYPEDVEYVKFTASKKLESYFYADNFGFCSEKPKRIIADPEKTFVYDFATYKKNTRKYEAVIKTEPGGAGDTITAVKVDGGLDLETQALAITYNRNGSEASKAIVSYTSSDFFKGNAGDDERTENRKTLRADMEYMTDLVFYGESTSGKNEKINIGVLDAANSATTPTSTNTVTLTSEWQQFRIPFEEFVVLDGGMSIEPGRVRGFVFSSASEIGEGSFVIDNITHTNSEHIEWSEPTPTPVPTVKPTATPGAEQTTEAPEGEFRIVTTAEEFFALTANDAKVKLGADIDLGASGTKTKCATYLDLNGHTLTSSASAVIELSHNFTLVDTGSEKGAIINTNTNTSYGIKCAVKNLTVNIDGAEISAGAQAVLLNGEGSVITIKDAVLNGGTHAINIAKGSLNIKNADINNNADYKGYALYASGGTVIVEDGTYNYNGTTNTIGVSGAAAVTINGGTFTNPNKSRGAINTVKGFSGVLTINGGTFENTAEGGYSILDSDEATTEVVPVINITGGTIKSPFGKTKPASSKTEITITGGTFTFDPSAYVDTENYSVNVDGDNMYTVSEVGSQPEPTPQAPTPKPTHEPTQAPTQEPTQKPTHEPTQEPTHEPTQEPTQQPTPLPSDKYVYNIAQFDEDGISIEVTIPGNAAEGDTMYVALYDDAGILRALYLVTDIEDINTFNTPEGASELKVFIWDKDMRPLAEDRHN